MQGSCASVGLDVHKETFSFTVADAGRVGEVRHVGTIKNDPTAIAKLARSLARRHSVVGVRAETWSSGYKIRRQLSAGDDLQSVRPCDAIALARLTGPVSSPMSSAGRDSSSTARPVTSPTRSRSRCPPGPHPMHQNIPAQKGAVGKLGSKRLTKGHRR